MAKLNSITFWHTDNYVDYDDSEAMTDYFNSYSLTLKNTIKWIKEDGAHKISVDVGNNDPDIPYMKRLKRIAKECGYEIVDKSHNHTYHNWDGDKVVYLLEFELVKVAA